MPILKRGNLFLSTNRTIWYSNYIRWFQKKDNPTAEMTHVGAIKKDGEPETKENIFESTWPKIRTSNLSQYINFNSKVIILEYRGQDKMVSEGFAALDETIKEYKGQWYGLLQLPGIALLKLFNLKHSPLHNGVICCELMCIWLRKFIPFFKTVDKESIDVDQFLRYCLANDWYIKYICSYGTKTFIEVKDEKSDVNVGGNSFFNELHTY